MGKIEGCVLTRAIITGIASRFRKPTALVLLEKVIRLRDVSGARREKRSYIGEA